jgi:uracil-DNA glycosylase
MSTEYMRATSEAEREALAHKIARLRLAGTPWDGPGGIVDSLRLVSSATQARALLRKYGLTTEHGGPVEIQASYDRFAINPKTRKRMGHREPKRVRASESAGVGRPDAGSTGRSPGGERRASSLRRTSDARHAPISDLVRRIRRERAAAVPDVDPHGPGIDADVLVVLRDPGRLGALTTNTLSLQNPDATAANQRRLFAAARLPLEACLFWNAVPWDLKGRRPSSADLHAGAQYLAQLVSLMNQPPIVVACGNTAHDACAKAELEAIEICHPSNRGLRGGGVNREPDHIAGLRTAARRLRARASQRP